MTLSLARPIFLPPPPPSPKAQHPAQHCPTQQPRPALGTPAVLLSPLVLSRYRGKDPRTVTQTASQRVSIVGLIMFLGFASMCETTIATEQRISLTLLQSCKHDETSNLCSAQTPSGGQHESLRAIPRESPRLCRAARVWGLSVFLLIWRRHVGGSGWDMLEQRDKDLPLERPCLSFSPSVFLRSVRSCQRHTRHKKMVSFFFCVSDSSLEDRRASQPPATPAQPSQAHLEYLAAWSSLFPFFLVWPLPSPPLSLPRSCTSATLELEPFIYLSVPFRYGPLR